MNTYDYSLLRGRIREYFTTEKNFAETLRKSDIEMSTGTFSNKINNKSEFTQNEISAICKLLMIPAEEIRLYFFKEKYELNS